MNQPPQSDGQQTRFGVVILPLTLAVALLSWIAAPVLAEHFSVPEFNNRLPAWKADKSLLPSGKHRVEGRVSLYDRRMLRLKNCTIPFLGDAVSQLDKSVRNVEVRGVVSRDPRSGELQFEVEAVKALPTDLESFKLRRASLREAAAEKWYALADWGSERAKYYNDSELADEAVKARYEGLRIERSKVSNADAPALFRLADRAKSLGAGDAFVAELNHEGCVLIWKGLKEPGPDRFDEFLRTARERLPGCDEPQRGFDSDLQHRYLGRPVETWNTTSNRDRDMLKRMLYADVLLRKLQNALKPDSSNLLEIAAAIERQIPEERRQAEKLRDQALALRARDVDRLTRTQLLALQADYRKRGQADEGKQLVETWLALKRRQLDPDDADGAIELADQYQTLLERIDLGDQLLIDAWSRHPGSSELLQRLEQRGYRLHEGRWLTAQEFERRPESRFEKSIRAGRVEPGMTSGQVRKSRGDPQRLTRVATAGAMSEQWIYILADGSRQVVRFERRGGQPEPVAVGTAQPAAAAP